PRVVTRRDRGGRVARRGARRRRRRPAAPAARTVDARRRGQPDVLRRPAPAAPDRTGARAPPAGRDLRRGDERARQHDAARGQRPHRGARVHAGRDRAPPQHDSPRRSDLRDRRRSRQRRRDLRRADGAGRPVRPPRLETGAIAMSETAFAFEPQLLPGGARFEAIVAAAASFDDRVDGDFFEPVGTGGRELRVRIARWLDEAASDPKAARRVVARRAATGRELGAGLRDVRLRGARRLPGWAQALAEFLAAQPATAEEDDASAHAGGIFDSFRRAAAALLDWRGGTLEGIELTGDARDDVAGALGVPMWRACEAAIAFELKLNEIPADEPAAAVLDVSLEGWLARLERLPGLAYVVGTTCCQWRRSVTEIFSRLRA